MKKIVVSFGTRPEIIKLAPVIHELERSAKFDVVKLHTGQHDELAENMLNLFKIVPDYDFKSMSSTSDLFELTEFLLPKLKEFYSAEKPDAVIVQGDTTSSYLCALAAFYVQIPVYHVEAGLRSFDNYNPFPEELNRKQISNIASLHFAPTSTAKQHLLNEGIDESRIFETGNTVIDALYQIKKSDQFHVSRPEFLNSLTTDQKLILVTAHRRENHGKPLSKIMEALIEILNADDSRVIVFPAHPNPKVREVLNNKNFHHKRLNVIEPLDYLSFHHVLEQSDLVLTDSGGIQEEAAALGKKMLVLRKTTERQELIENGFTKLVGSDTEKIVTETKSMLSSTKKKNTFNPYGDGNAAKKIVEIIQSRI
tara:strand:+ start:8709 stop:9809 length:1101 start_codon:yes stop_codon:yes gene_type:complete